MPKRNIRKRMSTKLSKPIQAKLEKALVTVGDMALKRRAKRVVEELELKNGDNILDIGCGNGYYLSLLNRLGLKLNLTGIDNDKLGLLDAERFIADERVELVFGNAEILPFKNNSFDKIIISEVIEHLQNEKIVLKEIYRVLKPGGILVLTTCNIDYPFFWDPINWTLQHLFNTHIKSGFWSGIWSQHLRMYKKGDVERLVKEVNFKIYLSYTLTNWCLPFNHYIINFIARILDKLFYSGKLPKKFAGGMIKFQNEKQWIFVKFLFWLVNTYDRLNDVFPGNGGVSIFVKGRK